MDLDLTILFQLALFLVVLVVLTKALFKPFLAIVEARHEKIHGTKAEVDRLERLASENQAAYLARVREARNVARQEREALRGEGSEEKRRVLGEVREEIANALNETRERVAKDEDEARASLTDQTQDLSRQLVGKVMGREVRP